MRGDLLHQVKDLKDVTNVILLTHNIDFVFLQSIAMSYLRRCGNPALTIFADADCAATSYRAQRELLDGMGTRYRVVPIRMHPGFVFHPKAVLLSGPEQATLYVGSGNLTFGGFRQNGEVWSRYSAADDGIAVFLEFRDYVASLIPRVPLSGAIQAELKDAYDPRTKLWTGTSPAGEPALIGRAGAGQTLLDAVATAIGPAPVDELVVCSPYYDVDGDALAALCARIPFSKGLLLHPGRGSTLMAAAWDRAGTGMTRRPCEIRHTHQMEERPGFVHAKFYAAIRGSEAVIVQGSANCTLAALLMDGPRGNAELLSVLRTSTEIFRRDWLDVLPEVVDAGLVTTVEPEPEPLAAPVLQILAARAENDSILVAYKPQSARIGRCSIDGKAVSFSELEPGQLHIPHLGAARALVLEGEVDGAVVASLPHWVDHERDLQVTARRRRLEDAIPGPGGSGHWDSDTWIEMLHTLSEHLKYTPTRSREAPPGRKPYQPGPPSKRQYEDLFAKDFSSNTILAHWKVPEFTGQTQDSVRKLLRRWLGIGQDEAGDVQNGTPPDPLDPPGPGGGDGEGDKKEDLKTPKVKSTPAELTERARKKMAGMLAEIEEAVMAPAYLENRPPDFLRVDLMMMSAILRLGYAGGWLAHDVFFSFTQRIWSRLFLSSSKKDQIGWLEWRRANAPDPAAFSAAMTSPQLSAAMIIWSLIGLDAPPSIERARFLLARALSAACMPELWFGGTVEDIVKELAVAFHAGKESIDPEHITILWREALTQGAALRELGELLGCLEVDEVLRSIATPGVAAGELLLQGRAGYCITLEAGSRLIRDPVKTYKLQSGEDGAFLGNRTMPVRDILEYDEIARALPTALNNSLRELIVAMRDSVAGAS